MGKASTMPAPLPGPSLSTQAAPPCSSAYFRTKASPRSHSGPAVRRFPRQLEKRLEHVAALLAASGRRPCPRPRTGAQARRRVRHAWLPRRRTPRPEYDSPACPEKPKTVVHHAQKRLPNFVPIKGHRGQFLHFGFHLNPALQRSVARQGQGAFHQVARTHRTDRQLTVAMSTLARSSTSRSAC